MDIKFPIASIKAELTNSGFYQLLFNDGSSEVYHVHVQKGKSLLFSPLDDADEGTTIFVLKGKFYHVSEDKVIHENTRLVFKDLRHAEHLIVIEDVEYLQIRKSLIMNTKMTILKEATQLIDSIEAKDNYTGKHCSNTGNLAVAVATLMKLDPKKIQHLLYASKLHDIGKINIPIEVLNKPSALTFDEYKLVQKHSEIGYQLIVDMLNNQSSKTNHEFYMNVAEIVRQHHEKYDGSGYPYGLTNDQMREESKILLVADCYDAMISNRPYKDAKSHEVALNELKTYAGRWYDKTVVETLEMFLTRFHLIQT